MSRYKTCGVKFVRDDALCETCGSAVKFDVRYSAHYCPACRLWCEPVCPPHDLCAKCNTRPGRPKVEE